MQSIDILCMVSDRVVVKLDNIIVLNLIRALQTTLRNIFFKPDLPATLHVVRIVIQS